MAVVVMGVSAAGKSTIAAGLAERLSLPWLDADDLHPPANVRKMAGGIPLDDDDRAPWLAEVGDALARGCSEAGVIIACSALKKRYRDVLRRACAPVVFVHLTGSRETLEQRMASRSGHFMPAALLDSQLAALEPLEPDEAGTSVDVAATPAEIIDRAAAWLAVPASAAAPSDPPRIEEEPQVSGSRQR